jgi:hypothetical protein
MSSDRPHQAFVARGVPNDLIAWWDPGTSTLHALFAGVDNKTVQPQQLTALASSALSTSTDTLAVGAFLSVGGVDVSWFGTSGGILQSSHATNTAVSSASVAYGGSTTAIVAWPHGGATVSRNGVSGPLAGLADADHPTVVQLGGGKLALVAEWPHIP